MAEPLIASFVVRVVRPGEADMAADQVPWRVTVRHVQTGEERQFARLTDAIAFIDELSVGLQESGDHPSRTDKEVAQ